VRALALAAVLAAVGGCGTAATSADGGGDGLLDGAPHDVIARDDAIIPGLDAHRDADCDFPRSCMTSVLPTHGTIMVYDRYLDYYVDAMPRYVFVDPEGITIFAGLRFLRADLDGTLVHAQTLAWSPLDVAQGGTTYGAVFLTWSPQEPTQRRFCVFGKDGPPDISACPLVEGPSRAWPVWDGTVYWLFGRIDDTTMYVKTYDVDGTELSDTHYPDWTGDRSAGLQPALLAEKVVMPTPGGSRGQLGCLPYWLDEFPRSLDPAARESWRLLPDDIGADGSGALMAQSSRRIALLYGGSCQLTATWLPDWQDYAPCTYEWPNYRLTFVTMVDADGVPLDPYPRCIPAYLGLIGSFIWDGAQFAYLTRTDPDLYHVEINTFDEDGNPLASGARPTLMSEQGAEILTAQLAAVGPNDYILAYALQSSGATYIARFSLVPL
jgi:hypothetical protein